MAIIAYSVVDDFIRNRSRYIYWEDLAMGDTGQPLELSGHADKTLQAWGVYGSGGSIVIEGSLDPRVVTDPNNAVWFTFNDTLGVSMSRSANFGDVLLPNARWMRPRISGGDGTTLINVGLACRIVR